MLKILQAELGMQRGHAKPSALKLTGLQNVGFRVEGLGFRVGGLEAVGLGPQKSLHKRNTSDPSKARSGRRTPRRSMTLARTKFMGMCSFSFLWLPLSLQATLKF